MTEPVERWIRSGERLACVGRSAQHERRSGCSSESAATASFAPAHLTGYPHACGRHFAVFVGFDPIPVMSFI